MKKRAVFPLLLALLLAFALLSSCGSKPTPGDTAEGPAQPSQTPETPPETPSQPALPDPKPTDPADGALSAPPVLTLQADGGTVTALLQPDRWSYTTAGGSVAETELLSAETTAIPLEDIPQLPTRQETLPLDFAVPPDTLTVRSWDEIGWGILPSDPLDGSAQGMLLTLDYAAFEKRVYELTAVWQQPLYSGAARYLFRCTPELSFIINGGTEASLEDLTFVDDPQVYPLIVECGKAVLCPLYPGSTGDTVLVALPPEDDAAESEQALAHFVINGTDYAAALAEAGVWLEHPDPAYAITDLDETDGYLEIALQEWGPSDDYATTFFRFDGTTLRCIGKLEGLIFSPVLDWSDMEFSGSGTVKSYFRLGVLQTWFADAEYTLNDRDWLVRQPQTEYLATQEFPVTVLQPVFLWSGADKDAGAPATGTAQPGDALTLVGTDDLLWIRVREADGASRWLKLSDAFALETPDGPRFGSEVLEGLCMAD